MNTEDSVASEAGPAASAPADASAEAKPKKKRGRPTNAERAARAAAKSAAKEAPLDAGGAPAPAAEPAAPHTGGAQLVATESDKSVASPNDTNLPDTGTTGVAPVASPAGRVWSPSSFVNLAFRH